MDRHERGHTAERLARDLLVAHGLEPLDANWRQRVGEIDLVMREPRDGTIVFVEVRYRSHGAESLDALGDALESVDRAKRARLRRAALAWLQRHGDPDSPARIDVVAIAPHREPCPGRGGSGGGYPDRIVARRSGCLIVWIAGAVEDAD